MTKNPEPVRLTSFVGTLAFLVIAELVLLRIGTRTLIHIPGLERYETPIRWLAEVGRFAYFAAVVFLIAVLVALAVRRLRRSGPVAVIGALAAASFLLFALAGRFLWIEPAAVGWAGMAALVLALIGAVNLGRRIVPLALFTSGAVAAGWSILAQGRGGGLSIQQVDSLLIVSEVMILLAALSAPLLLQRPPSRRAILIGLGVTVLSAAVLSASPATMSILVLWSFGAPGWLSGLAYSLALGSVVMVAWAALQSGEREIVIGLVLLAGGGIGMISTYQTGLVVAALLLMGDAPAAPRITVARLISSPLDETARFHVAPAGSGGLRVLDS
ncbi:MAG: hypothetical protein WD895_07980 [Acidimicrobiia bacterium]